MKIPNIDLPVIAESIPVEEVLVVSTPKEFYAWDFNNPPWESYAIKHKKEDLEELQPEDYTKY